jgi:hypothetical protein
VPVSFQIDSSQGCVFVTFEGVVTDAELLATQKQLRSDPACQEGYSRLIDATKATAFAVTPDGIRTVAQNAVRLGVRKAALIAGSDLSYGILRMYESYSGDAEYRVFRHHADALEWLKISTHSAGDE